MNFKSVFILSVFTLLLAGCLTTPEPNQPVRVELLFEVEELGESYDRGENSITVNQIKFSVDRFNLIAEDSSVVLQSGNQLDTILFTYTEQISGKNLVLGVQLGFEDVTNFEGYEMFLRPVSNFDSILDQDFFGDPDNFSLIMKGEYNGEGFIYNSTLSFDKFQDIGIVRVGEENETLSIDKTLNISDVIIDPDSDTILDPTDSENESKINSLFSENLKINGSAVSRVN